MKQITFKTWALRELSTLGGGSFNFGKLAARVQVENDNRMKALLLFYSVDAERWDKLESLLWNESVRAEYRGLVGLLGGRDITRLALRSVPLQSLPDPYKRVLEEYVKAYSSTVLKAESKRELWQKTREVQLRRGISNSEIYHALDLNPGNVNAYLKHGAVEKVSLVNARRIAEFVNRSTNNSKNMSQ